MNSTGQSAERRAGTTDANATLRASIDVNRFRRGRVKRLVAHIETHLAGRPTIRILDAGGVRSFWEGVRDLWSHLPIEITVVNLGAEAIDAAPIFVRPGNACALDFPDNSFDLVYSNSVIEHVGHWPEMQAMAREVSRVAPHLFIQTPDFWFPIEPHYRTLFFQWYPASVRAKMLARSRRGFRGPAGSIDAAMKDIETVNLLTATQMQALFPDARIEHERVFGFSKSLIAVR